MVNKRERREGGLAGCIYGAKHPGLQQLELPEEGWNANMGCTHIIVMNFFVSLICDRAPVRLDNDVSVLVTSNKSLDSSFHV